MNPKQIFFLVFAFIIVLFASIFFRYEYRLAGNKQLYKIDRITGEVWFVRGASQTRIIDISNVPPAPAVEAPLADPAVLPDEKDIIWDAPVPATAPGANRHSSQ
ncbi:MAG: hypothetical protein JZU70_09580 [Chlorobium sp.]|jgi:hypothetical protein|nr:hypothetical protein [Chlorobium sp.]